MKNFIRLFLVTLTFLGVSTGAAWAQITITLSDGQTYSTAITETGALPVVINVPLGTATIS